MNEVFTALLTSKKFMAALAGLFVGFASKIGLNLPAEDIVTLLSPIIAYIVGQGIADHGKEKAAVENEPKMILANKLAEDIKKGEQ